MAVPTNRDRIAVLSNNQRDGKAVEVCDLLEEMLKAKIPDKGLSAFFKANTRQSLHKAVAQAIKMWEPMDFDLTEFTNLACSYLDPQGNSKIERPSKEVEEPEKEQSKEEPKVHLRPLLRPETKIGWGD